MKPAPLKPGWSPKPGDRNRSSSTSSERLWISAGNVSQQGLSINEALRCDLLWRKKRNSDCHEQYHFDGNSHARVMPEHGQTNTCRRWDGLSVLSIYVHVLLEYPVQGPSLSVVMLLHVSPKWQHTRIRNLIVLSNSWNVILFKKIW